MKMVRISLISLFLFSLLLTTGCSLHKSRMPESRISVPSSYLTMQPEEKPAPPIGRWWEQFGDEELNALMEESFRNNLDIAQAYERLRQSQAVTGITDSSRKLSITIDGSGGRSRQSGFFRGGSVDNSQFGAVTFDTYSLSAGASYEIDLWKKLDSRTEAARFEELASGHDLKALYISISAQLADLYYLAIEQRAQMELSDQTIESFQDTLDRVERRYQAGLVPALDVYQSRQNLAAARAQRSLFESRLLLTQNKLSVLIGRFPEKEIGGHLKKLNDAPPFETGIPSQLLTRRPDITAALLRLKASDASVAAAIADRFPSFNLIGTYGGTSDEIRNVLDSPNIFWNILLQLAQPVLDGGRRKAEVDRTEAVFSEHLASYHKTVLNAFREVEDALVQIMTSEERIRSLQESVNASESAHRLALDRYLQGLSDYLPVLTEQLRHFTAKSNLLTEKRTLISNRIQLVRALGGEWADDAMRQYVTYKNTEEESK
jgi:NodT family efflux transporter outer membrane factor (OMF) lipoprotein